MRQFISATSIFRLSVLSAVCCVFAGTTTSAQTTTNPPPKKPAPTATKPAPAPVKPAVSPSKPGVANGTSSSRPAVSPAVAGRPGVTANRPGNPVAMSRPAPRGASDLHSTAGDVRMRPGGRGPMDVHDARRNMDIHHNLAGGRRIESVRPGGVRFVSERGRPGYIGHPYMVHGREFERRTYYDHGRAYDRFYRPYGYHGYNLRVYAPGRYFPGAYYGWAYRPWRAPVRYGWGFRGQPWFGYYGAYYQPYPVYASPSLWLTDYMLSQTLAASYQARLDAGADGGPAPAAYAGPPISPEAKQLVANEVQNDIALENQEATVNQQQGVPDPASSGIARLMSDGRPHAFVAGREVDVVDGSGLECAVTDGDVLQFAGPLGPQDATANVVVMASKGGKDCQQGTQVAIGLDELQEMSNHMREQVDAGLQELAAKQGTNGLPGAPASALADSQIALVAQGAPPPDPAGAQELAQQDAQAQQAEQEVLASASNHGPSAPPPGSNEDLFKPTPPPPPQ
jgi:hypothetical protein